MAGFAGIGAVSTSIARLLRLAFEETQPIAGAQTRVVLVRTDDLDLKKDTEIVFPALSRFAEYAAGMIDKPKRFFDVPLTVARLGIVFPDQTAQRRPHLLIGGKLWDS